MQRVHSFLKKEINIIYISQQTYVTSSQITTFVEHMRKSFLPQKTKPTAIDSENNVTRFLNYIIFVCKCKLILYLKFIIITTILLKIKIQHYSTNIDISISIVKDIYKSINNYLLHGRNLFSNFVSFAHSTWELFTQQFTIHNIMVSRSCFILLKDTFYLLTQNGR